MKTEFPRNRSEVNADHSESDANQVTRREFIGTSLVVAGSLLAGQTGAYGEDSGAAASSGGNPDLSALRKAIKGQVLTSTDSGFEATALDVWNKYVPIKRLPQVIVRVADEQDVVEAVKATKANKLKVVVRGGGHNWCNPSLRNGGMLIDLTNLNKVVSIDAKAHKAVVQPIISNREIQAALNAQNLSYPSGHCPQVKLSGYLLCGGMSWNQGVWGTGAGSVEAVELVTANGELITADKDHNADYYWAARGAGPGFFGVATRYHLKLYDLPKAIVCSSYYYPISEVGSVARWLESIADKLAPNIELTLFMVSAPPELAEKTKADGARFA